MFPDFPPAVRQAAKHFAQIAVTFLLFSFCNAIAVNFEVEPGVSILFPATAIAIIGCMYFGVWAAIGVILGTIVTPWSAQQSLGVLAVSGVISALEGLIPYFVFRARRDLDPDLRDIRSLLGFLLFGTLLNTGFSAVAGNLFVVKHAAGTLIDLHEVAVWWIADFTAALLLATPVIAFGGALTARWRQGRTEQPRTITNTLQVVTVVLLLGFATSFAIRSYLLNRLEDERLEQQQSWTLAENVMNEMHSNFLSAAFVHRDDPAALRKIATARRMNEEAIEKLERLFATNHDLAGALPKIAAASGAWFARTERSLEAKEPIPGDEPGRETANLISTLHETTDRANEEAWVVYAAKRHNIMIVADLVDSFVFVAFILAAATLIVRVTQPFAQVRSAIAAMREGKSVDGARIDSPYLEFRSIAETLEETSRALAQREDELKRQTERAIAASNHKSDFLAKMSHELRTPLNSIIGFTDLVMEQEGTMTTQKRLAFLQNVHGSAKHLLNLINDLLDITKVESGKMKLHFENVDLRLAIANTVASTTPLFARKKQEVEVLMPEEPMIVRADVSRVEQVLLNLLSNANKFSPDGQKISVRSGGCERGWRVEIVDRGIGIRAEDHARIFDEFEQLHARGPNSNGTGLGLALAKRFVEAHGGAIEVASAPGGGSTFSVTLPRV